MKTLILDFDGTIADTRGSIIQTIQATMSAMNLPQVGDSEVTELIGLPLKDTFQRVAHIGDETLLAEAISIYRKLYRDICFQSVTPFPNVKQTLQYLFTQGVTIAVASSKGRDSLRSLLDKLEILPFISIVLGEEDAANKKPAPDMVLQILAATHTAPEDALVVGDTAYDIAMGQGAHCPTCGVTYGNHSKEQLQQQKADYIIDDFKELLNVVQSTTTR